MPVGRWMIVVAAFAAAGAQAQLRLPSVALPSLPVTTVTQTAGRLDPAAVGDASALRRLQIADLIRRNPRVIEADRRGEPIVRQELLASGPSESALQAALAAGYEIIRERTLAELDLRLVVLRPPQGWSTEKGLRKLHEADAAGSYDFNHVLTGSGLLEPAAPAAPATPTPRPDAAAPAAHTAAPPDAAPPAADPSEPGGPPDAAPAPARDAAVRIGLIDSGVDVAHPVFAGASIHRWGCGDAAVPAPHGTAVASLLIGRADGFHGVHPRAELYAADVYCGAPAGGAVDALAAAVGWLVQNRVAVINVSLVGPDNAVLARVIAAATARGYLVVAAVGNDGPAAPPLYPAAYAHVIGVTGVDAHRRALPEAARGVQVMFSAPGADMAAAALANRFTTVRGTSFAAPIVAALLAENYPAPVSADAAKLIDTMAARAIDLGPPGRDLTYGFGLLGADAAVSPAGLIDRR